MPPLSPEQAALLLQIYLPGARNEHRTTKNIIAAIPADKADYRPDHISKSALELAWHIVASELRFLDSVAAGEFDMSPRPRPEEIETPSDLVNWYSAAFEARCEKLAALPPDAAAKVFDFRGMMQLPAVMYMTLMMHHSVHHRGQLSMYLRPMGAKVPSIYGESHDSAEARKTAQQ